jgi:hypothetical protein
MGACVRIQLHAFLVQRASELGAKPDAVALHLAQTAPIAVAAQTDGSVRALAAAILHAIDLLEGPRVQRLFQLQTSPRSAAAAVTA